MHWIIIILLVIALYIAYLYLVFLVSAYLFPLGCVVLIGAVLFNYLTTMWREMIVGQGWADSPVGAEPAFRQYYFRKAYHDYSQVVEESWARNRKLGLWVIDKGKKLFTNGGVLFTWPLGITFFAIAGVGAVAGAIAYATFGLVHLVLVLLCGAIAISIAGLARLAEYASMTWRRIFLVCPHANCYRPITLPKYICPNCGATHLRLLPGSYGIFRRICKCTARLPTLFLIGRNNLPSFCPHDDCGRPLNSSWGVIRNLHVPIVGGPASGKTSFMMASMCELYDLSTKREIGLEFPEKKHQTLFERCRQDFVQGTLVAKTAEESPDAFLVKLETGGAKSLLYIYDAAGELYQHSDTLARHEYYSYTHGVVFLLDPFSLPQVQVDYASSLKTSAERVKPCAEMAQDVYDRMIGTLRSFSNSDGAFKSIPFAVVVTKADAFGIAKNIEVTTVNNNNSSSEPPESNAVRQWLINNGESNLVRCIENDFKKVRYFHCSSLGRLPDSSSSPFDPEGVLDPLGWVLKPYDVRFEGNVQGSISAASKTPQSAYAPKIGGRIYNGAVISALWLVATISLLVIGGQWATGYSVRGPNFDWNSRASNRPVEYQAPAPIVGRMASTTTDVNLRAEANKTARKVGLAPRDSRVRVLGIAPDGTWCEVQIIQYGRPKEALNSDRGWLNSSYLLIE
jgi:GTPase SAR1 family protein